MKVAILGADGYIGWALAQFLARRGHDVLGIDNGLRRRLVIAIGGLSVVPISTMSERVAFGARHGIELRYMDVAEAHPLRAALAEFGPDAVVNLAQIPSAPYSMAGVEEAQRTWTNNLAAAISLLWAVREEARETPIITLGTMGEYGTPSVPIPEGWFELGGEPAIFPRRPSSTYHASKVGITYEYEAACRFWGARVTDIMQGVVYGCGWSAEKPVRESATRKDVDEMFGTALDRFVAQAKLGLPLTVYGAGTQVRGFLPLVDSLRCIELLLQHPPKPGECRHVNQFDRAYSVLELAETVARVVEREFGREVEIDHVDNPRVEKEAHFYQPDTSTLRELGYKPAGDLEGEIARTYAAMDPYLLGLAKTVIMPKTRWS